MQGRKIKIVKAQQLITTNFYLHNPSKYIVRIVARADSEYRANQKVVYDFFLENGAIITHLG